MLEVDHLDSAEDPFPTLAAFQELWVLRKGAAECLNPCSRVLLHLLKTKATLKCTPSAAPLTSGADSEQQGHQRWAGRGALRSAPSSMSTQPRAFASNRRVDLGRRAIVAASGIQARIPRMLGAGRSVPREWTAAH